MTWTAEIKSKTIEAWDKGLSAKEISQDVLGGQKSRSAVLGWISNNQDLVKRKKGMSFDKRRGRSVITPSKPKKRPMVICKGVSLLDLGPDSCRYPLMNVKHGQGDQQIFCGNERVDGSSWCAAHREFCVWGGVKKIVKSEVA